MALDRVQRVRALRGQEGAGLLGHASGIGAPHREQDYYLPGKCKVHERGCCRRGMKGQRPVRERATEAVLVRKQCERRDMTVQSAARRGIGVQLLERPGEGMSVVSGAVVLSGEQGSRRGECDLHGKVF